MADLSAVLFSKADSHHLHDSAFVGAAKCCMGFDAASKDDTVGFGGVFVNEDIHAFLIYPDFFDLHGRDNRTAYIVLCDSVAFQDRPLTFRSGSAVASHGRDNEWMGAS